MPLPRPPPLVLWTFGSLLLLLAWDAGGLDRTLAHWFGTAQGFALRDHWLFEQVLHRSTQKISWLLLLALTLAVWWPVGVLRRVARSQRVQWVLGILLALLVVTLMKARSQTSCPWDVAEFGGLARYVSHWSWGEIDGGGAHCFPAGHAATGFVFVNGYFVLRTQAPVAAQRWLVVALGMGLLLGLSQQVRGAHFMSHTLWTGWLCWTVAYLCDSAAARLRR